MNKEKLNRVLFWKIGSFFFSVGAAAIIFMIFSGIYLLINPLFDAILEYTLVITVGYFLIAIVSAFFVQSKLYRALLKDAD